MNNSSNNQPKNLQQSNKQTLSKTVQHMQDLLKMFNIKSYDQNIPHTLLEFAYNSISKNIEESVNYLEATSSSSNKDSVNDIPPKLIQYTTKQNYRQKVSLKSVNSSMAMRKNKQPLPVPNEHNPMCYPPEDDCLINSSIVFIPLEAETSNTTENSQSSSGLMPALKLIPSDKS